MNKLKCFCFSSTEAIIPLTDGALLQMEFDCGETESES